MIIPQDISLKELEYKGLCTECGTIISDTDHYCNTCKSRVVSAIEIEPITIFFKQFLADKLNEVEKGIDDKYSNIGHSIINPRNEICDCERCKVKQIIKKIFTEGTK